ncbi:hypothetical protein X759_35415 [Mesorhizobium sp. LSHC420B00]|nr:hypothetical protein X759_35415 [Mesorhizobium sp. LSHC420B00]
MSSAPPIEYPRPEGAEQAVIARLHILVVFLEGDDRAGRRRVAEPLQHHWRPVMPTSWPKESFRIIAFMRALA